MLLLMILAGLQALSSTDPSVPTPIRPEEWITTGDYPAAALRAAEEGRVAFRLDVDDTGAVERCTIVTGSGSPLLDLQTCSLLRLRARFSPARAANGTPIASSFASATRWLIPAGQPIELSQLQLRREAILDLAIGTDGRVTSCKPITNEIGSLDPCLKYAVGSRYNPPTLRDGIPVATKVRLTETEIRSAMP